MAFTPENDLERALVQGTVNPASWAVFYHLLLGSELFVLGLVEKNEAIPGAQSNIRLAQISLKGRIYHPIFSAPTRLTAYAQEHPQYFSMKGRELFQSAPGAYFLLNPGSEYARELPPGELAELLNLVDAERNAPHASAILISAPIVFPTALADALRNLFTTQPSVEAAYLAQMSVAGKNEPPHPIVGVKLDGEWEPLAKEIQRMVAPFPQWTRLAAMPISGEPVRKSIGDMLMRYEPFYVRTAKLH